MTEPARVLELRRELAELGDPEPGTADLTAATRASILAELADLGAPATPAAEAPRPLHLPVKVQVHHPAPRALPASSHPLPAAPAAPEPPMPKPTPPPAAQDPQARLAQLLERLDRNDKAKNANAGYQTRGDIRKHCAAHGLPVPEAALRRPTPKPTAAQRPRLPKAAKPSPEVPPIGPEEELFPIGRLKPSSRIRALRSQALEMLPEMEDLSPEEAALAHDEMDLLTKVLVLGGQLISRRTA